MDYSFKMQCPACGSDDVGGAGGTFGGRVDIVNRRCYDCGQVVMIVPMKREYEYKVSAKSKTDIEQEEKDWDRIHELQKEIGERYNELSQLKRKV